MQGPVSVAVLRAVIALGAAVSSTSALACTEWKLPSKFSVNQGGVNIVFEMGRLRNGVAHGSAHYNFGSDFRLVQGSGTTTLNGDSITMDIVWEGNAHGLYTGSIDGNGKPSGTTRDLNANGPSVFWSGRQKFKCAVE